MFRQFRRFHVSALRSLRAGDKVPSATLYMGSPSAEVNLAEATKHGKFLVLGVPGAFSPGCSKRHIPEFIKAADKFKRNGFERIFVVTVNDSFVAGAWEDWLFSHTEKKNGFVEVLADPTGEFSREWGVLFDAKAFFGNERSARYAAVIENGEVAKAFVEKDNTSVDQSSEESVSKALF